MASGAFEHAVLEVANRLARAAGQDLGVFQRHRHALIAHHHRADHHLQDRAGQAAGDFALIAGVDPGVGRHVRGGELVAIRRHADGVDRLDDGGVDEVARPARRRDNRSRRRITAGLRHNRAAALGNDRGRGGSHTRHDRTRITIGAIAAAGGVVAILAAGATGLAVALDITGRDADAITRITADRTLA